jgi:hypothetical protein
MASLFWEPDTSAVWSTAGNWSTGSAPVDNDLVYVDGRGNQSRIGAEDQSSIELDLLQIDLSYVQNIGTTATTGYLQIGADKLVVGQGMGVAPGPICWHLNLTADVSDITVVNTHPMGLDGLPSLLLVGTNTANTYTQQGGWVGIGLGTPAQASEIQTAIISGGRCDFGTGMTLNDTGATMHISGNAHVTTRSALGSVVVSDNACLDCYGIGATVSALTLVGNARCRMWARNATPTNATISTLQIGDLAVLDARPAVAQLTITNTYKSPGNWKIIGGPGQVVHTDSAVQYGLSGGSKLPPSSTPY